MVARHYYRYDPDEPVAEVPNVLRWSYVGAQKAEQGEASAYEIVVSDRDMTASFVGHRRWIVYEDESDDDNEVIIDGITQAARVAHTGADITNPDGRVWVIEVADLNTLWGYRVMTGSDSQFAEDQTDVDRVLQVLTSEEMGYFDDLTFVADENTVEMDEFNGRGQTPAQIVDSCSQETGKNFWIDSIGSRASGADIRAWYDRDASEAYTSPLSLSNAPGDLDMAAYDAGTAIVLPIGKDTEVRFDYARQYTGAYGEFQGGAKYISQDENPEAPEITLGGRDMTHPAPEIKTRSRMKRRLLKQLALHSTPDEVIKTTITVAARKASQLRAGMRIPFKATHLPGYENFRYLRIMSATIKPIGNRYEVALELQGPGTAEPIEGTTVELLACNSVVENGERNGSDESDPIAFTAGEVWSYTLTNPGHDGQAVTDSLRLDATTAGPIIEVWGANFGEPGWPTGAPAQGSPPTSPISLSGTFIISSTATGTFRLQAKAGYYGGPAVVEDECWAVTLEKLS